MALRLPESARPPHRSPLAIWLRLFSGTRKPLRVYWPLPRSSQGERGGAQGQRCAVWPLANSWRRATLYCAVARALVLSWVPPSTWTKVLGCTAAA